MLSCLRLSFWERQLELKKNKVSPFANQVYALLVKVPKGRVTTYKVLADAMGIRAYQAIGQVMRINPFAPEVPCHRVVASDGKIGGFMGSRTGEKIDKKIKLLESEGVTIDNGKIANFSSVFFDNFF